MAEEIARTFAAFFAIQIPRETRTRIKVWIFGDNENARAAAEARHRACQLTHPSKLIRGAVRWCDEIYPNLTWHHNKAHIGLPWNELADVVADFAAEGKLTKLPNLDTEELKGLLQRVEGS